MRVVRRRVRKVVEDVRPEPARLAGEAGLGSHVATYCSGGGHSGAPLGCLGAVVSIPAGTGLLVGPYAAGVRVLGGILLLLPVALVLLGRRIDRAAEEGPRVYVFDGGLVAGGAKEPLRAHPWPDVTAGWRRKTITPPNGWDGADKHHLEVRRRAGGELLCTLPARESEDGATTVYVAERAHAEGTTRW